MVINATGFEQVLWDNMPGIINDNFGGLISLIKTVGIIFIGYVVYMIVMEIITWKKIGRGKRMEERMNSIEKKLDKVLSAKQKRKRKK